MERLNLIPAIKAIEEQLKAIETEYLKKRIPYEESLKKLREINETCEVCFGRGKVLRERACLEDDRTDLNDPTDYVTCSSCHGIGKSKAWEEERHDQIRNFIANR